MDHDLAAERTLLEREIASLQSSIETERARLNASRTAGIKPRGLVVGLVTGLLVGVSCLVTIVMFMMSIFGKTG